MRDKNPFITPGECPHGIAYEFNVVCHFCAQDLKADFAKAALIGILSGSDSADSPLPDPDRTAETAMTYAGALLRKYLGGGKIVKVETDDKEDLFRAHANGFLRGIEAAASFVEEKGSEIIEADTLALAWKIRELKS